MVVTLEEMKNYLRVDFDDDDALLDGIIVQSQQICMDVARFTDLEEFEKQPVSKIAVMFWEAEMSAMVRATLRQEEIALGEKP